MKFWICWRFCITKPLTATMKRRSTIDSFIMQTARENVDSSKDHFKDLVMRLLGDKDHEKVLDNVCKVKKSNRKKSWEREDRGASVARS